MDKKPIATIGRTREIQEKYGVHTKKSFGQNFITQPAVVEKIASAAVDDPSDLVFEIGPGIGALTEFLAKRSSHVVAFEIDERLPAVLKEELGDEVTVVLKDILETDIDEEIKRYKSFDAQKVRFASNLPYYITTPILFKLFEAKAPIDSITAMMQKEVGERFLARDNEKEYNALSVITQYRCNVEKVMDVSRNIFWPKPNVDSIVLRFTFHHKYSLRDEELFFEFVKGCFRQRRKTIYNNLGTFLDSKEAAAAVLEHSNIPLNTRAQQLKLEDYIRIYEENYEDIRKCKSESGS